jgi:hypothetical protein
MSGRLCLQWPVIDIARAVSHRFVDAFAVQAPVGGKAALRGLADGDAH